MPDSRDSILNSIRQSLRATRLPAPPVPEDLSSVARSGRAQRSSVVSLPPQFADELAKLNGAFLPSRVSDAPELIARLVRERNTDRVRAWDEAHLPVPGLHASLRSAGLTVVSGAIDKAEAEKITVGITGVEAALADTATLAVRAGAGRPRLAWLSVYTHIALFTPAQLYPSLAAWWAAEPHLAETMRAGSELVLITGPSRTADIEMTLTVGVHGPGEVIAVLVQP
jgi:L-lactate dehydrogenase complex protein LldG